ncbi:MAG TPA: hypothetical protein VG276_22225 [Actinomycetes bacterium]|jgi:hypothetical protein|nr:hypothetical protein [Actinomycetes bacterium]
MARVDLNKKRAARSEAENTPHEVALGFDADGNEQVFLLKPRMPLEFTDTLAQGTTAQAVKLLLVDPGDWDRFLAAAPEDSDLLDITDAYGLDLPELSASAPSSTDGGPRRKRTSGPSTRSPSRKLATAPGPSGSVSSTT